MSVLKVKNGNQWDIVPAIKGDPGDPAADESITDDMLVTDGIKTEIEWLWGNQLTDSREGEILHAEDAYTAPAVDISVDGKSTQVTTTGKNLLDPSTLSNGYITSDGSVSGTSGTYKHNDYMPVIPGTAYRVSEGGGEFNAIWTCFYDEDKNRIAAVIQRYQTSAVATAPDNAAYMRSSFNGPYAEYAMIEVDSGSWNGFEPYTGGMASPSPDWPQDIVSADELELNFAEKNLFDIEDAWLATSYGGQWHVPTYLSGSNTVTKTSTGVTVDPHNSNCGLYVLLGYFPTGTYTASITKLANGTPTVYACPVEPDYGPYPAGIATLGVIAANNATAGTLTFTLASDAWILLGDYINNSTPMGVYDIQLEAGSTATDYEPYSGNTVPLLPDGYSLRSLPDGTKDELHLSYLRPSKRAGWAWYSRELVQRVVYDVKPVVDSVFNSSTMTYVGINVSSVSGRSVACTHLVNDGTAGVGKCGISSTGKMFLLWFEPGTFSTDADAQTWIDANNLAIQYPLATPTTETLDPIELPIMPSQTVNVWSDPATNLKMTYIQDSNLIIENLEATIADIATS